MCELCDVCKRVVVFKVVSTALHAIALGPYICAITPIIAYRTALRLVYTTLTNIGTSFL